MSIPEDQASRAVPPAAGGESGKSAPNFDALAENIAQMIEEAGRVTSAWLKPIENGQPQISLADTTADAIKTFGQIAEYWLIDPQRALEAQTRLAGNFLNLWGDTFHRLSGNQTHEAQLSLPKDRRFDDPLWNDNPVYDFLAKAYLLTSQWASELVEKADSVEPKTRERARFYLRQLSSAVSPSNFLFTNPRLLKETIGNNGENLVRGMKMLSADIAAGQGQLRLRQTDTSKFELGVNLAATPGQVIFRNDLIELIHYTPTKPQVLQRPLLIVPPWINKFYILDLNPEKSFIRWALDQGLSVFVISWVNPDKRLASKSFENYMREGIFAALEAIESATGERQTTAIGYCVGGTLLAATLAYMAQTDDDRIANATFFTTQVDFTDPGELKNFTDEPQIEAIEAEMNRTGYLDGAKMANTFNMLRPADLIWTYMVNNYIRGETPKPFDLLTWNADSTRMTPANHSFYLRNCYLENRLAKGEMELGGIKLDLSRIKIPIYDLAAREDHIAPAESVFRGAKLFGGQVRFVLAGSGHIAGVINPTSKPKYQYWIGETPKGDLTSWIKSAQELPGSWWPDWFAWNQQLAPKEIPAPQPGQGKLPALMPAPGSYVRVKC